MKVFIELLKSDITKFNNPILSKQEIYDIIDEIVSEIQEKK